MKNLSFTGLLLAVLFSASVSATTIDYALDNLGGGSYQYNYTLGNDTLGFDVDQFSVYFDLGLYENLVVTGQPADWFADAYQPDPFLPDDGFFDAYTFSAPVAAGDSLGGFSVSFDWLGGAAGPGDQYFELFDFNWDIIDAGLTTLAGDTGPGIGLPEPNSLFLFALGLAGMSFVRRQRTGSSIPSRESGQGV